MATQDKIVLLTGASRVLGLATAQAIASFPSYHSYSTPQTPSKLKKPERTSPQNTENSISLSTTPTFPVNSLILSITSQNVFPSIYSVPRESSPVEEACIPLLEKSSASILIFISTVLRPITARSGPNHPFAQIKASGYRTSKAALNILMACYAQDQARSYWKVAICPGFLATELNGPPEMMLNMGATEPETGASLVLSVLGVLGGKRDTEKDRVVNSDGVRAC